MQYRKLGNTGLIVSALSLGTMQYGEMWNLGRLNQDETTQQIRFAMDHGINFIDTADIYSRGESETWVGNSIRALGVRDEVVIATKVRLPMSDTNPNFSGAHRVNIMRGVENSLRRLQTDVIDLYQLHSWDSNTPLEETLRAMDDCVRQGKVRYIGFSNYYAWQGALAIEMQKRLNLEPFIAAQMYYSLTTRDLEHEFMPFCEYSNVGILVWSPLAGGYLSGKYSRDRKPEAGTRFGDSGQFLPIAPEKGEAILDVLWRIANARGCSPARIALAWTMARPMISSVIIAARNNDHLADNIAAADMVLTADEMNDLNAVSDPGQTYPHWMIGFQDQTEDLRPRVLDPERYKDVQIKPPSQTVN